MHMHVPTGVSTFDPLSWFRAVSILDNHFSNIVPLTYAIGQWDSDGMQRLLRIKWGNVGVLCWTIGPEKSETRYGHIDSRQ